MKLLLDTDIGTDIDDAVCLAYLLSRPDCELLGITTVGREPQVRAQLADAICRHAGRDVPIRPGAGAPLSATGFWSDHTVRHTASLGRWDHADDFPAGSWLGGIELLSRTIRAHPGEVTLLAIGPLTNLALLQATDPQAMGLLRSVVIMAGSFKVNRRECNAMLDPWATSIVYRSPGVDRRTVPLDVTRQVRMDAEQVRQRFSAPLLEPVLDMAGVHFQQAGHITFHDPLAAAVVFEPGLCTWQRGHVAVEVVSELVRGLTAWEPDEAAGLDQVAATVDADRFFAHFFATL